MVSLNRVIMIGNLTKDPELRYTPSGTAVATLRLAANSSFKSATGERKEETCFVNVIVWNKQAEICTQYLKKGRSVFVEGRLIYRSWEAEGKTRSTLEIRADRVQFLGPAGGGSPPTGGAEPAAPRQAVGVSRGESAEPGPSEAGGGDAPSEGSDADVPF